MNREDIAVSRRRQEALDSLQFEREREDYVRYMSEDDDRGNGGGRRGGSRRGSGSYRDD